MIAPENSAPVFHESWHRIASQRVSLRPGLRVHRQMFRGQLWYVLRNPFSSQFWRVRPPAYEFLARLGRGRTVQESWDEILRTDPENAPGQGEAIELLGQLYQANMVRYEGAEDGETLFERKRKRDRQKIRQGAMNILFLRIPLFDPDPLLRRLQPLSRILFGPLGAALWIVAFLLAVREGVAGFDQLRDQAQGVLAPSNLVYLYVASFLIKVIHEFGHGMAVRRQGGEVHGMGVMFMMLAPMPYTDASAAWAFRERWRRVLVSCSGVLFELFVASLALLAWSRLGEGPLRSLCYNVFFVASVTTLLFNANPLMRFDGYYVLSDLLDLPNLQQVSGRQLKHLFERHVLRLRTSQPVTDSVGEGAFLAIFSVASAIYRTLLFGGILVAVSQHYLIVALLMGVLLLFSWAVFPLWKFFRYLLADPRLETVRSRAITTFLATAGAIALFSGVVPFPDSFTAPGVVEAQPREVVVNGAAGRVVRMVARPGTVVNPGDTLVAMVNPELDERIEQSRSSLREARSRYQEAVAERPEDMMPAARRIEVLEEELVKLSDEHDALQVRATVHGVWASLDERSWEGRWIRRGDSLGEVVASDSFRFLAVVPQSDAERLFAGATTGAAVRLDGSFGHEIGIVSAHAVPVEHSRLPSAALGWYGGGDIETDATKGDPEATTEPFHLVQASLAPAPRGLALLHGRSGRIRFVSGTASLATICWRRARQLVQKHYRL